jgi:hypothetical protein
MKGQEVSVSMVSNRAHIEALVKDESNQDIAFSIPGPLPEKTVRKL